MNKGSTLARRGTTATVIASAPGGGFPSAPFDATNLRVWLEADEGFLYQDSARTTLATANSDPVGSWSDFSGQDNHVLQATAGNRPLYKTGIVNGLAAVLFDGSNDYMASAAFGVALTQPNTVFVVCQAGTGTPRYVYDGLVSGNRNALYINAAAFRQYAGSNDVSVSVSLPTTWDIWRQIHNGVSSYNRRGSDGTEALGFAGNHSLTGLKLCAQWATVEFFNGYIAEFILFNEALSAARQNEVGTYLATKYALTWTAV